ncbi:MAG: hemerythrin domain-containing protein [Rhodospirillaceae bacterium]|nr:hemerythrin domain-containing protein [Rhodospirillaceae bacterium]
MNDLRQEHGSFAKLFDILERQLTIFHNNGKPDYDLISDAIDLLFHFPHRYHHPKEDAVFEKLAQREPAVASNMADLKQEHDALHDLTQKFASNIESVISEEEIARDEVIENLHKLADFQHRHMQMEEDDFLPVALKILTPEDWDELDARAADANDPAFGAEAKSEFSVRYEKILRSLNG